MPQAPPVPRDPLGLLDPPDLRDPWEPLDCEAKPVRLAPLVQARGARPVSVDRRARQAQPDRRVRGESQARLAPLAPPDRPVRRVILVRPEQSA